jgi:16S rRNA (guanine527-N7)-methyltransferase
VSREREPLPTRVKDTPDLPIAYDVALQRGLAALGIELDGAARSAVDGHVRMLLAWTTAINLTAIRDPAEVALLHVVDSLTAAPWLRSSGARRAVDLGSGGGFPGIPLAIACPDLAVTLLEPINKKSRFLAAATGAVGLGDRVAVVTARAEALAVDGAQRASWPVVTARAVAPLAELVELAFPLLASGGSLLAWKRGDITTELAAASRAMTALGGGRIEVRDVPVDDLLDHRLVVVTRTGRVPDAYPRDPAARRRRAW